MPGKVKIMYLNYINKSFTAVFQLVLTVNVKSTYIMNIFLRLWKSTLVSLSLLSFSVLFMYVSIERLKCS